MAEFGPPCPDVRPTRTRRSRCSGALLGRLIPLPNGTLSPLAPKPGLVISPGPASQGDRRNGDCLLREGCNRYVPRLHRPTQRTGESSAGFGCTLGLASSTFRPVETPLSSMSQHRRSERYALAFPYSRSAVPSMFSTRETPGMDGSGVLGQLRFSALNLFS
jgi:hypothetical protein